MEAAASLTERRKVTGGLWRAPIHQDDGAVSRTPGRTVGVAGFAETQCSADLISESPALDRDPRLLELPDEMPQTASFRADAKVSPAGVHSG
jgi:hypothetical protein